jgi:hypothetical protein
MKNWFLFLLVLVSSIGATSAQSKKVLFIGNSYTGANNLPQMFVDVVNSAGDSVIIDAVTPGGYRFLNHSSDATTLSKIASNNWDYVALQAQSQEPSWPIGQVQQEVFPHAAILCNAIRANNACSMPMFYRTWGRKNGDAGNCASWPPVCTYEGMDSLLNERYQMMADDNEAIVSPVGAVWKYIISNNPTIELYSPDESHPSVAGTYAAACTFYTTVFRKDPLLITFDSSLPTAEALTIRNAVKAVVFNDFMEWNIGEYDPVADFSYVQNTTDIDFTNKSDNSNDFLWFFGDGDSSSIPNPVHTYLAPGDYYVTLDASKCGRVSSHVDTIEIVTSTGLQEVNETNSLRVYPNPAKEFISVDLTAMPSSALIELFIYSDKGNVVRKISNVSNQLLSVRISDLPTGFYVVKANSKSGQAVGSRAIQVIR